MTYKTHRANLFKQMQSYLLYMLECDSPDDVNLLHSEIHRLKDRIDEIDRMHYTQQRKKLQIITMTVESGIKFK